MILLRRWVSLQEPLYIQVWTDIADSIEDCSPPLDDKATKWVHVRGVHDIDIVKSVGEYYNLHPLVVEDIPSVGQRPKFDSLPNSIHIVLREYDFMLKHSKLHSEQVSIVFGSNFVLSFQQSSVPDLQAAG